MGTAVRTVAVAVSLAALTVLTGCSAPEPFPDGPTESAIAAIQSQARSDSWAALFPGEPEPAIVIARYVTASEQLDWIGTCLDAADLNQFSFDGGNLSFTPGTPEDTRDYDRAVWICYQLYPLVSESVAAVYFNDDQLSYLYDVIVKRTIPCLRLAGFALSPTPSRDDFIAGYRSGPIWNPYSEITSSPREGWGWPDATTTCPPPPFARTLAVVR